MVAEEEFGLIPVVEGSPVAADDAVMDNDGLENATVVVGFVPIVRRQDDVAALVADEVFVIRGYQQVSALAEPPRAAVIGEIECPSVPFLLMN